MRKREDTVVKSMDPEGRLPVVPRPPGKSPDLRSPFPVSWGSDRTNRKGVVRIKRQV